MKTIAMLFCVLLIGCMDNGVKVADNSQSGSGGKLSFSLSKTSIPQDIASLTFTLTNLSTSETVSKTLVVSTDTLMQVAFEQLTVGAWHVKVVAKDSTSGTKYSGESDANVIEGQTTQLSLSLSTLTSGVGTLVITVNWPGTAPFVDYSGNPVFSRTGAWYDVRGVETPCFLADSGKYKMWFQNYGMVSGTPYGTIGLAESVDGINWTRICDTVMFPTAGAWDSQAMVPCTVIKDGGLYRMYYSAHNGSGYGSKVGMATSQDGIHWMKNPNPIIPTGQAISNAGAVKVNGTYYLYYNTYPPSSVYFATSTDGSTWQISPNNPVLTVSKSWETGAIACGNVLYENGTFTMVYSNIDNSQSFGLATSTDGIHWTKDVRNPVFSPTSPSNGWSSSIIGYPVLVRMGTELRMYYMGFNSGAYDRIGYAVKR